MSSRLVLVAGFGGLLLLVAFAGFDGLQALRQIQASDNNIREDFLLRTRVLERIRADVYVSGTYVRDYLLEPESGKAEGHRYSLLETRSDMDAALRQYRALLNAPGSRAVSRCSRRNWPHTGPCWSRYSNGPPVSGGAAVTLSCATKFSRAAWLCWALRTRLAPSASPS